MIVEFIGESGCGKTTLSNSVFPKIEGAQRKGHRSAKDNLLALLKINKDKELRKIYKDILRLSYETNGLKRYFKNSIYLAGHVEVMRQDKESEGLWIIDQGYLQFLQTVYFNEEPKNDHYKSVVENLMNTTNYLVVACKCDTDTLMKRIKKRESDREKGRSADNNPRRIENADKKMFELHGKNMERVLSCIPEDRFIIIDTSADTEENAGRVCGFIRSRRGK